MEDSATVMPSEEGKALCPTEEESEAPAAQLSILSKKIHPAEKTTELYEFFKTISMKSFFRLWGVFIGQFPIAFLIAGIILCSLSAGIFKLKLRDNVRDGYTPSTSRSRYETHVYRQFLGSEGDPATTTVLILARDEGSMHRLDYFKEAVQEIDYMTRNLSVQMSDGNTIGYMNFCGGYCDANEVLMYFLQALAEKMQNPHKKELQLTYPIADLLGYKLHLERNFFGVQTTDSYNVTNIEYVKLIAMTFLSEVKTAADYEKLGAWELKLFEYCTNYTANKDNALDIMVIGAEIVDTEMNKDGQKMAPKLVFGFLAMFIFLSCTVLLSSLYFNRLSPWVLLVTFMGALLPVFAVSTTLGLTSILGFRTNSLLLIMPFLIMGIGVNDSFLTVHSWLRQPLVIPRVERLGRVLEEVGPSITTTTLTNVVTFLIGYFTPTEEISIFCLGCALALGFAYIYTVIIFVPVLYYCSPIDTKEERSMMNITKKLRKFFKLFLHYFCKVLCHRFTFTVLFLGCLVYWSFGVLGTVQMTAKLDTQKILPKETPILLPNKYVENIVWAEFYPVTVIVNNPVDIRDVDQLNYFYKFVNEFEKIPTCKGTNFTILWLRDYQNYFFGIGVNDFDYFTSDYTDEKEFGYSKLSGFLGNRMYKHHKTFLNLRNDSVPVSKFSFIVAYENNTSWDDRINLMLEWRRIADMYPKLNATVWNVNAMFVDQMLSLKKLTWQTCLITIFCMLAVCVIFIQNLISVVFAVMAIASISLGVMGYLSFWNLDLDPVSLCSILISIGMAVDFVAHTIYHFQLATRTTTRNGREVTVPLTSNYDRMKFTISNIAWPMIQGGLSTVICILPLIMLQNYIPLVFVKTISLVVIWGLFHGLVLLPTFLAQAPLAWLDFNIYHYFFMRKESLDDSSEQELNPLKHSVEEP